jgi:hypothetical protein
MIFKSERLSVSTAQYRLLSLAEYDVTDNMATEDVYSLINGLIAAHILDWFGVEAADSQDREIEWPELLQMARAVHPELWPPETAPTKIKKPNTVARKRGSLPIETERVKNAIRADFRARKLTVESLNRPIDDALAADYGTSRSTREAVLPELIESATWTGES